MGIDGQIFRGECMGIKSKPAFEEGGQPMLEVGVSVPKAGGFPGETQVLAARLTKEQVKAGVHNRINSMIGKRVELPVELNTGKTDNGRTYSHYRLVGDPIVLAATVGTAPPVAAVK